MLKKHGLSTTGNKPELLERAKTIEKLAEGFVFSCVCAALYLFWKLRVLTIFLDKSDNEGKADTVTEEELLQEEVISKQFSYINLLNFDWF